MVWWVIVTRLQLLVLGSIGLRLGMFPVSVDPSPLEARMQAIHRLPRLWVAGWTLHGLSSLALLWIFVFLADFVPLRAGRLSVALGAAAVAVEMVGGALQIALLDITQPSVYAAVERVAWLLPTYAVSSLWAIAAAIAAATLGDRRVRLVGGALSVTLVAAMLAGLAEAPAWGETTIGISLWLWCAFAAVVSRR